MKHKMLNSITGKNVVRVDSPQKSTMWVGTFSGVTSPGMVISSARGGTYRAKKNACRDALSQHQFVNNQLCTKAGFYCWLCWCVAWLWCMWACFTHKWWKLLSHKSQDNGSLPTLGWVRRQKFFPCDHDGHFVLYTLSFSLSLVRGLTFFWSPHSTHVIILLDLLSNVTTPHKHPFLITQRFTTPCYRTEAKSFVSVKLT